MLVVAGLSMKNLKPRVWDSGSAHYLEDLRAIMVSYADFHRRRALRRRAMDVGLRALLDVPPEIEIYLDNGAFYFGKTDTRKTLKEYVEFAERVDSDWKPVPRDYIPLPAMSIKEQRSCLRKTMRVNRRYGGNGYVSVIHVGGLLSRYAHEVQQDDVLSDESRIALGGIVPHLLRSRKAQSYKETFESLVEMRRSFSKRAIHVFGVGGTATLHITRLIGLDSVDSSGWRNRAARGMVQLAGRGERLIVELGSWGGRAPSGMEWEELESCGCPACGEYGLAGMRARGVDGFQNRATHNLFVLLEENRWLDDRFAEGTYGSAYRRRIENSTYAPIIEFLASRLGSADRQA